MIFILDEVPAHSVGTWCFVHFTVGLFTNKAQFDRIFRTIETNRRCCADYIGSDSHVSNTSVSNCFYYVVTIALSVITDNLICIELYMRC